MKKFIVTIILLIVNMAMWILLLLGYIVRFIGEDTEWMYLIVSILLLVDIALYGVFMFGLWKDIKFLKFLLIPFVSLNALLSITDEFGLWDIIALLLNLSTGFMYLYEKNRNRYNE